MPSSYYEIRVAGTLPPEVLLDFERLTASVEPVETVVHGPLQALLMAELARRSGLSASGYSYRLTSPLYDDQGLVVSAVAEGDTVRTSCRDRTGRPTATGTLLEAS